VNRVHQLPIIAMIVTIVALTTLGTLTAVQGCATVKPVAADVIDCAKAEATSVAAGFSLVQIAMDIIAAIKDGPSGVIAAIEALIRTYGPDIVACVVDNYPETGSGSGIGSGSGSGSATPMAMTASQDVLNKHMVLSTLFAGKKITHTGFKKPKS